MKNKTLLIACISFTCILLLLTGFYQPKLSPASTIRGAWHLGQGSTEQVLIFQDGYFSHTTFDKTNKKFLGTYGGIYKTDGKVLKVMTEFDTRSAEAIGKEKTFSYGFSGSQLTTDVSGVKESWAIIDEGKDNLSGVWRFTGRMADGQLNEMPRGDRKTLKLLSGTRFQWMAINPAIKEFFGTGGGTYTFVNGKYTEHIEFFFPRQQQGGSISYI